jgi:hypothetical protein
MYRYSLWGLKRLVISLRETLHPKPFCTGLTLNIRLRRGRTLSLGPSGETPQDALHFVEPLETLYLSRWVTSVLTSEQVASAARVSSLKTMRTCKPTIYLSSSLEGGGRCLPESFFTSSNMNFPRSSQLRKGAKNWLFLLLDEARIHCFARWHRLFLPDARETCWLLF